MSEITYYPLNQSQKLMFFQMTKCPCKQIVNICTEVEFQEDIDQKVLMQALYLGIMRVPSASTRLHMTDKTTTMQYFSDAAPEKIEYLDYTGKTTEQLENDYKVWNGTPFPNKQMDTQLYVLKLIKKPNGKYAVYGCYSHTIFDAYSIMTTMKEILGVYKALINHTAMPADLPSPLPAYEVDYKYQNSEKHEEDRKFFDEYIYDTEPQYTHINGKDSKEFPQKTKYGKYYFTLKMPGDSIDLPIPRELNARITEYALANKISPQSVYLLAVRTFLSGVCDVEDVYMMNTVARRATIAQKRAGGTMINSVPLRFRFPNSITFADACKQVYETQCTVYRHANFDTNEALDFSNKKFNVPTLKTYHFMALTYQPFFVLDDSVPVVFRRMPNGCETQGLYMSIMPNSADGDMICNYAYQVGFTKPESIRKLHEFLLKFTDAAIKNPDKTLSEFISELL